MTMNVSRLAVATVAGLACLFINDDWSSTQPGVISHAQARVGQPLSAASVAGVHRRASRRAYRRDYYGAGAGVATATGVVAGASAAGAYAEPPPPDYAAAAATGAYAEPARPAYPEGAPSFVHDSVMVEPGASATVTDPATGRTCTISTSGYHWCWTP
jgi:hypothetical protein